MIVLTKRDWLFRGLVLLLLPILWLDGKVVFWFEPRPYLWVVLKSQQLAYAALVGVLGFAIYRNKPLKHNFYDGDVGWVLSIPVIMMGSLLGMMTNGFDDNFSIVLFLPMLLLFMIEITLVMAFGLLVWFLSHKLTVGWRGAAFPPLPGTEEGPRVRLAVAAKIRLAVVSLVGIGLGAGAGVYWLQPKIQYVETEMRVNGMLDAAQDLGILEASPMDAATRKLKDTLASVLDTVQRTRTPLPAPVQDAVSRRQGLAEPVGEKQ